MKEEIAITKWCPFVIITMQEKRAFTNRNQRAEQGGSTNCKTYKCMAWVDETLPEDKEKFGRCGLVK
jgi:hypothetical protein